MGRERKLTVKIPAGIATGQRLRLYGEGEHGSAGGPPGDLYVVVHVQEHPFFHREEDDLYCEMPISFPTLALGGNIKVPTLNGRDEVSIPAGTQPGARFKLRGKGMPHVTGRGHGDLHVIARVAVPKKLTKEQKPAARGSRAHPAAAAAGRGGGRRREAVLRARQRYLWLATPPWTCGSRRGRAPGPSRTCSTRSSIPSSRSRSRNTSRVTAGASSFARRRSATPRAGRSRRSSTNALELDAVDVDDEDWARRSQAALKAARAGRIVIAPPWDMPKTRDSRLALRASQTQESQRDISNREPRTANRDIVIVIDPSTGFGTGHHATTRLCLELLQELELRGTRVIDVGTGSGVLAIAAAKLGARHVTAIDNDPDALRNARDNVQRNAVDVEVLEADLSAVDIAPADVVLANLTAAVLQRFSSPIRKLLTPAGTLIVSGFGRRDVDDVAHALGAVPSKIVEDGDWVAAVLPA